MTSPAVEKARRRASLTSERKDTARALAGYRCSRCGGHFPKDNRGRTDLEVHHIERLARGGTHQASNLEVICSACHRDEHALEQRNGWKPKSEETLPLAPLEETMSEQTALARPDERRHLIATPASTQMPIETLASHLVKAGYFKDTKDVSQAIVKVMYGQELGFPAISSMMGIHIIEGKPVCSSSLMAAMVKKSGRYNYRVIEATNERCEIAWLEHGQEVGRNCWTIQDAQRAELAGKGTWKKYPKAMLFSRTVGEGVRFHCADLFGGAAAYTEDEARDEAWDATAQVGRVDTTTGEVIDVRGRMSDPQETVARPSAVEAQQRIDARPTQGFIGGRPAETVEEKAAAAPTDIKGLQNAVKACLVAIGQSEEQAGKPREYLAAVLDRDVAKLSDLSLSDWKELHAELRDARTRQTRMFAAWNTSRKGEGLAEADRFATFSDLLGRPVETTSLLTPAQMDLLSDLLTARANGLPAQTVMEAEVVEESNPFVSEPEHEASAFGKI